MTILQLPACNYPVFDLEAAAVGVALTPLTQEDILAILENY